jgi:hypothetical protein
VVLRSYLVYWWKLGLSHFANWGFSNFFVPPCLLGFIHAEMDLSQGISKVYFSGMAPLWVPEAAKILGDQYQVEYINLNHWDHSEWHESYERSYNAVTQKAIRLRFGLDVIELCLAKAEFQYRQQQRQLLSDQIQKSA